MTSPLRIIVTGLIAQYPLGGVTWDYFQYVLGLSRLGHDVFYFEDTGQWPFNPLEDGTSKGCDFNVAYLHDVMQRFGLGDRWAYRFPHGPRWYGLDDVRRSEVISTADLLINVSGSLAFPGEYSAVKRLVYIDSDPVFTQIKLARGQKDFQALVDAHDVHFTFGEALGDEVPSTGHDWKPTRQPIVLSEWNTDEAERPVFTTVMNWTSYRSPEYQGKTYGQKDIEFERFIDLPSYVSPIALEIAVNSGKTRRTPRDLLKHRGWHLVDPNVVCPDLDSYRSYLASSRGEWSVAKNGYVVGQSGWFSCRSACYLAAGRPVVVQDTGFSSVLPAGEGIISFTNMEEAIAGLKEVDGNHARHSRSAREIAAEYFDSDRVVNDLLDRASSRRESADRESGRCIEENDL